MSRRILRYAWRINIIIIIVVVTESVFDYVTVLFLILLVLTRFRFRLLTRLFPFLSALPEFKSASQFGSSLAESVDDARLAPFAPSTLLARSGSRSSTYSCCLTRTADDAVAV